MTMQATVSGKQASDVRAKNENINRRVAYYLDCYLFLLTFQIIVVLFFYWYYDEISRELYSASRDNYPDIYRHCIRLQSVT